MASDTMKKVFEKLLALLRVRTTAAGLEISDQVARLVYFDGKAWQMHAIRLTQGVMEGGRIKDRGAFIETLAALKEKAGRKNKARRMNVIVGVSSVETYTQIFNLPFLEGESLDKAVELNLQMTSPLEAGEARSGWQVVGRDPNTAKLEILSAFVERKVIDEMVDALFEAGFLAMAVESRELALTRVLREKEAGMDVTKPYLFVNIGDAGIDFLIIRNGALYFEYANPWRDLADEKGEITLAKFEATFAGSLRQVMNFYSQHWEEPLFTIIFSATALAEQAEKVIAENTSLPVTRLTLATGERISPEWLVALGCGLRGARTRADGHEISLLGEDSQDRFHKEQLIHFIRFWRVLVPVSLGILILTLVVADAFLSSTKEQIELRSNPHLLKSVQTAEIASLEASANDFNRLVALAAAAESMQNPKNIVLEEILLAAAANKIAVDHVVFQSFATPVNLSGVGGSQDAVVAFKAALQKNPHVSGVNLPLTGIRTQGNTVSFSMTFLFTPPPKSSRLSR